MNILDIFVIAVIGFAGLYGLWRGFVRTVFSLFSTILVIILTLIFTPVVSNAIIDNTAFDEQISEQVIYLTGVDKVEGSIAEMANISYIIDQLPLPENMADSLKESYDLDYGDEIREKEYGKYIGDKIARAAINYLIFIILFLIIATVLNIILLQLDLLTKLPVIKQLNKLGGFGVGLVLGLIIIWVSCLILGFWVSVKSTQELTNLIENSIFFKIFFMNNPISSFVSALL